VLLGADLAGRGGSSPENLVRNPYTNFGQAAKRELDGQLFNRLTDGGLVAVPPHVAIANQLLKSSLTPSQPPLTLRVSYG